MTTYLLRLPYSRPPLSLNQRIHWAPASVLKRDLREAAFMTAKKAGVPRDMPQATVVLKWYPPDARRRDTDNPTPTLKSCIDGLVTYGLIQDDSSEYVKSECVIGEIRKPGEMWLEVTV